MLVVLVPCLSSLSALPNNIWNLAHGADIQVFTLSNNVRPDMECYVLISVVLRIVFLLVVSDWVSTA